MFGSIISNICDGGKLIIDLTPMEFKEKLYTIVFVDIKVRKVDTNIFYL